MSALFVNVAQAAPSVSVNTSSMDAIFQASPVVQLTLLILILLSVFCWAIGFTKYQTFKKMTNSDELFLSKFWKVNSLDTLYEDIDQYNDSSIARVFKAAYLEMKKISESPLLAKTEGDKPILSGIDNLQRVLNKASENEISKLESRLTVLATTGSTGPFIGLFGTVWGIMGSFHKIGQTGTASLAVVAPGISEALIATAIGLAAAIPAVVLYNNFISRIRKQEIALNNFNADFLNIVKRNFFQGN
ncbi:protein TolQ [Bdellovibrio bacteriovorus]|uniref:Protein TolQ n=1 Tax=Bdellovibrio bacteriovorus TaxID=959 RepID=A0A161PUI3_BDEBC|nr:protein TolQ [Bdellovibrio bacteriovorus]KYG69108.1 protein TolQ [Bdellovibrio bacteriovorus]